MKMQVPYYSQYKDVEKEEWKILGKARACTAACLKMVFEYFKVDNCPTVDEIFEESLIITQDMLEKKLITELTITHGITHDVITLVSHNHGVPSFKEEFKSVKIDTANKTFSPSKYSQKIFDFGIKEIFNTLKGGGLVLTSVLPGLSNGQSFHTVLLVGFEEADGKIKGFYYHDPDSIDGTLSNQYLDLKMFDKYWRKQAIFFPFLGK
ncbi:MAG: hypothetical protein CO184_00805 [Candidatus Zambryskibacteria bacterium CG_4_9_14_3_um_filter_40_16]|uniref:Peptidase C39-like domain-containing protein n=2 Tax=Candidatus Zambryskiibacteriota TaxID=1817925 RepID=A0A2H0K6K3_9BACT|nr:MAG: hypothetical protein COV95_01810 [Candidatus Zambryskibacteria bacterium CG11_big_fil_rev_8_21_14_0_20_40_24]PJA33916.1 MAG: hypothetical protein CO184_00805 [Candidatus Zambryskibacteria bacterium CG_4_9_14_3_um_filter_40_16]